MSDMSERTGLLVGDEGVRRLSEASVILAGVGAVGGYALEGLVRAGVGRIRVVDADAFSDSNLNRQILATVDTIGRPKAEVACERARSINPGIEIEPMSVSWLRTPPWTTFCPETTTSWSTPSTPSDARYPCSEGHPRPASPRSPPWVPHCTWTHRGSASHR